MLILITSCSQQRQDAVTSESQELAYEESIDQWHREREAELKSANGWLTLAGLYWLDEGDNTFGSGKGNDLEFPSGKIPERAGVITLRGDKVKAKFAAGVDIHVNGKRVQQVLMYAPDLDTVPELAHGPLTWFVIRRGDKYGIRLRDLQNDALIHFKGIKRYPVDAKWRIEAKFEQHATPRKIAITNIVGQTSMQDSPGTLVFTQDGKQHRLDALLDGDQLFIIFADKTNGVETYGAGRYLYTDKPGPDGITVLDFNKATNPPCDFVSYATCPLPPRQNFLSLSIEAGEKSYGEY
ncbi:DUF1684 domain-containing protein [Pontibacter aquaedesilientis]|uniref:DUF1684 domain-containing protein n=1 Tax=Pontibacter aquaedesilientis TaxID=2766980 RepID=UPI001CD0BD95|nr:DUF1684 domain-containing protein [Pontibacter aquaedesilientis]